MTKPTTWSVRPAKPQISLGIRPVLHADSEDSDQLIWGFARSFCSFCRAAAHILVFCFKSWVWDLGCYIQHLAWSRPQREGYLTYKATDFSVQEEYSSSSWLFLPSKCGTILYSEVQEVSQSYITAYQWEGNHSHPNHNWVKAFWELFTPVTKYDQKGQCSTLWPVTFNYH